MLPDLKVLYIVCQLSLIHNMQLTQLTLQLLAKAQMYKISVLCFPLGTYALVSANPTLLKEAGQSPSGIECQRDRRQEKIKEVVKRTSVYCESRGSH